jgi:hypothetical protein
MMCSACGAEIVGEPLIFGPLTLCPEGCVPDPEPDLCAVAERYAAESANAGRRKADPLVRGFTKRKA